jgi:hypothetical protein
MATDPREPLGRIVHEKRLAFNSEKERPFVLQSWEDRDEGQRELDMRIGSAVAARALADWEAERAELTLARLSRSAVIARITALCRGIRRSAPDGVTPVVAVERILAITGEPEERSDEKEADRG